MKAKLEKFQDEIDAWQWIERLLDRVALKLDKPTHTEYVMFTNSQGVPISGGAKFLWNGVNLVAQAVVVRGDANWSVATFCDCREDAE